MNIYEAKFCHVVKFNGGQILLHEGIHHTSIEVRTNNGWRIKPLSLEPGASHNVSLLLSLDFFSKREKEDLIKAGLWEENNGKR